MAIRIRFSPRNLIHVPFKRFLENETGLSQGSLSRWLSQPNSDDRTLHAWLGRLKLIHSLSGTLAQLLCILVS